MKRKRKQDSKFSDSIDTPKVRIVQEIYRLRTQVKRKMILATEAPVIKKKKGKGRRRLLRKIPIPKIPKVELEKFRRKLN